MDRPAGKFPGRAPAAGGRSAAGVVAGPVPVHDNHRLVADHPRVVTLGESGDIAWLGVELGAVGHHHVQGTLHVVMADGSEFDARPGDVTALPQGHDAWVVGDEPVVVVDWYGASNYART